MKRTVFCLPKEWMNYRYSSVTPSEFQAYLYHMTIIDSCQTDHGYAFRLKFFDHGRMINDPESPCHEYVALMEANEGKMAVQIADLGKDRLPGYEIETVEVSDGA